MKKNNLLLSVLITFLVLGCTTPTPAPDIKPKQVEATQDQTTSDPYATMRYNFTATILQSRIINTGRGAAAGKFPTEQLIAKVVEVTKGEDIRKQQEVFIELKSKQASCNVGDVCHFVAPYKHPSYQKAVLILEAQLIP